MRRAIKCKKDFYRLASLGLCGNTLKTWDSLDSYLVERNQYPWVGLRRTIFSEQEKSFGRMSSNALIDLMTFEDFQDGTYVIIEAPNPLSDTGSGLQGELSWGQYYEHGETRAGWMLYYTTTLGYMRTRLRESGKHVYGFNALRLLRQHCSASEYREMLELFDYYTDIDSGGYPVIEFAVMRRPIASLRRRCVVWEIRSGY